MTEDDRRIIAGAVSVLRDVQRLLTDDERVDLWEGLQEGYCRECGRDDPRCQCTNDE